MRDRRPTAGTFFAIRETGVDSVRARTLLAGYGPAPVEEGCRPMATNLAKWPNEVLLFCPVLRAAGVRPVSPP